MDLRANAIIQGVDRFSPMMQRIGATAGLANRGFATLGGGARRSARSFSNMAGSSMMLGAGLGMVGRGGFDAAYGLEHMMNKVQAVGQLTDQQRKDLGAYAQELNKLYPFTNQEIAGAAFELFRAGFNFEQARGALQSTLDMALAGDIERSQAADIATNVLTAMRLPMQTAEQAADSARRVSDVLAYAATKSNTDIRLLGETFKYVAPLAASAGMSLEDVAASAMTMANNGIKGSEAGIAMRSALVRMAKPTKDMMATLGRLNIDLNEFITGGRPITADDIIGGLYASGIDASGQRKRIEAMLENDVMRLKPAQLAANLTDLIAGEVDGAADRNVLADALLDTLTASGKQFDLLGFVREMRQKGVGLAEIARIMDIRQGGRVLTMLLDDLEAKSAEVADKSAGAARRMADTMQKGIVGALAKMKAAYENFWVSVGNSGAMGDLGTSMLGISEFLQGLSKSNPDLLRFGAHILAASVAMSALGFAAMGLGALFASPLVATVSIVGMAGLTTLLSNWDKLEWLFNEPHKIDIIFPELPDWLKNAWDMAVGVRDRSNAAAEKQREADAATSSWTKPIREWFERKAETDPVFKGAANLWDSTLGAPRNRVPLYAAPSGFAGASWAIDPAGGASAQPQGAAAPMIRDIAPASGPANIDVTGKVDAQLTGSADVKGEVTVNVNVSPSEYLKTLINSAKSAPVAGKLNTGKSMPDAGAK